MSSPEDDPLWPAHELLRRRVTAIESSLAQAVGAMTTLVRRAEEGERLTASFMDAVNRNVDTLSAGFTFQQQGLVALERKVAELSGPLH